MKEEEGEMRFQLSEELEMTRAVVREFAEQEVGPTAGERDEEERFDRSIFRKMGELGLTGIPWPEQYGGAGGDFLTYTVVLEELSRVCASTGAVLAGHIVYTGWPICHFGSEEQKKLYLTALSKGSRLGAYIFPRYDGVGAKDEIIAELVGDEYILNGSNLVVNEAGEAEIFVVYAQAQLSKRKRGYCAFIVERGTRGFGFGKRKRKLGMRSLATSEVLFESCRIPKSRLIGSEKQGNEIAMSVLDLGRLSRAAQAVGVAQGAMEAAVAYAKERMQFGKPIGRQQGISFKLADMAVKIEGARWLAYQAAWRKDAGLSWKKEAAIAKQFAAKAAVFVTTETVQVFGGYGYIREYQVERFMRDAKCIEADEGTEEMRKDTVLRILLD
jgi:butyryl-CoA dehydrogenase